MEVFSMKKLLTLVILLLVICLSSSIAESFTLHSGTTFGMTMDEVIAKEAEKGFEAKQTTLYYTYYDDDGKYMRSTSSGLTVYGSMVGYSDSELEYHFDKDGHLYAAVYIFGTHDQSSYSKVSDLLKNKYGDSWNTWYVNPGVPEINDYHFSNTYPDPVTVGYELHSVKYNENDNIFISHLLCRTNVDTVSAYYNLLFGGTHVLEYHFISEEDLERNKAVIAAKEQREKEAADAAEAERNRQQNDDI